MQSNDIKPSTPKICSVLNVNLRVANYNDVVNIIAGAIDSNKKLRLNLCNVHVTMSAQSIPALMSALNHPDAMTLPDGMPLVWAMRTWGEKIKTRVYGPDLFDLCMSLSEEHGFRHFFFGSTPETLKKLNENLKLKYNNLNIAGSFSPPFRQLTPQEEKEAVEMINDSEANIVWVGLGAPKQEIWTDAFADKLNAPVVAAIGAAFDFHAGTVKQAPDWIQDMGFEWLYRLIQEPRRLWFRYLYYNPLFIAKFTIERLFSGKKS